MSLTKVLNPETWKYYTEEELEEMKKNPSKMSFLEIKFDTNTNKSYRFLATNMHSFDKYEDKYFEKQPFGCCFKMQGVPKKYIDNLTEEERSEMMLFSVIEEPTFSFTGYDVIVFQKPINELNGSSYVKSVYVGTVISTIKEYYDDSKNDDKK